MADYQLFGLKAGGYHLTNLLLHILSTLLLFWLFHRMTGAVWKSAFVAGLFALHPLHVESVAWIAERKDVLSAFFWMLTLCLYVYYTEKPAVRRYLLVVFSFILALMSKPMVVTLPLIMILLDYWPLRRFESQKENLFLWQLKEKTPFFILSIIIIVITFYNPQNTFLRTIYTPYNLSSEELPLLLRIANAPVSFVTYLEKTFWPHDLAIFYPFQSQIPLWQVIGTLLLIIVHHHFCYFNDKTSALFICGMVLVFDNYCPGYRNYSDWRTFYGRQIYIHSSHRNIYNAGMGNLLFN